METECGNYRELSSHDQLVAEPPEDDLRAWCITPTDELVAKELVAKTRESPEQDLSDTEAELHEEPPGSLGRPPDFAERLGSWLGERGL